MKGLTILLSAAGFLAGSQAQVLIQPRNDQDSFSLPQWLTKLQVQLHQNATNGKGGWDEPAGDSSYKVEEDPVVPDVLGNSGGQEKGNERFTQQSTGDYEQLSGQAKNLR